MTRRAIIQSHRPPEAIQGTLGHSFAQGASGGASGGAVGQAYGHTSLTLCGSICDGIFN